MKTCSTCKKLNKHECRVLQDKDYPFEKYGECWAYTDDPTWEKEVAASVDLYRELQSKWGEQQHENTI